MEGAVLGGVSVCLSVRENYVTLFIVDEKGYIFLPSQSAKPTIRLIQITQLFPSSHSYKNKVVTEYSITTLFLFQVSINLKAVCYKTLLYTFTVNSNHLTSVSFFIPLKRRSRSRKRYYFHIPVRILIYIFAMHHF